MEKLYLIDGMSLVFRAYHALIKSGFRSPEGVPTGAVFGFTNIITNFLTKENPKNIAVAFDTQAPTFRKEKFDFYKANRAEFPEELEPQVPLIKELLDLFGIARIEMQGFEADDIIGTIAKEYSAKNYQVYCITSDKDFYQLINDNTFILKPAGFKGDDLELVSYSGVYDKFGVAPNQVIDVLALIGDSVDNIPGVKGIGDKTAIPLIQQFGNIENIYENLDKIEKQSVLNKLISDKESAFISKELATIDTNVKIDFSQDMFAKKSPKYKELDVFFKKLGFTKIREFWRKQNPELLTTKTEDKIEDATDFSLKYEILEQDDTKKISKLIEQIKIEKELIFSFYSEEYSKFESNIISFAFLLNNTCYIINFPKKEQSQNSLFGSTDVKSNNSVRKDFQVFATEILNNKSIKKISYNIKQQIKLAHSHNYTLIGDYFDIMLASYLINPDDNHSFEGLILKYCSNQKLELSQLQNQNEKIASELTLIKSIYSKQKNLIEQNKLTILAETIEFPLLEILSAMEIQGVRIDLQELSHISTDLGKELDKLTDQIYYYSGEKFNIESPKQLGVILFEKLKLPPTKKIKSGYSTDISVLTDLLDAHPIIENLIEYRQLTKLKNTYIDSLPKMINPKTKNIHTNYQQTVAVTGRLSSIDPNLQNIPIRTDKGKEVRKAFVSCFRNGLVMSADYSQIELRIMAYYSKDATLMEAFQSNQDVHTLTAARLFDKKLEEVDSESRRVAKTVNFGIMYGLGAFGLAQRLRIPRNTAAKIIDNYFYKYPGIKKYISDTIQFARDNGYVETLLNRRRYFPQINHSNNNIKTAMERAAINHPIQGTAADMMKLGMINVYKEMINHKLQSKMILQVHDEIVIDLIPDEEQIVREILEKEMINALVLENVPIKVEIGIGKNWLEAH